MNAQENKGIDEQEIMFLCRSLGGTVYETVRMADSETLIALRRFIDMLSPAD